MASKSAHTIHDIHLFGAGVDSGHKALRMVAEYDPQSPQSIIPQRHLDALQIKIEHFPQTITTTFYDRHRAFYIPTGTVMLRWFTKDKPVTTKFYVVNTLAPQYAAMNVDVVLGGAEDIDGVIANLFDDSVPVLPTYPITLSKEQKEKQKKEKQRKAQKDEQDIKDEQAAEAQQRDIERQERLQKHQQQQQQQQSSP